MFLKKSPLNIRKLTYYELNIVKESWLSIEKNTVTYFHVLKENDEISESNSLIWFFNIFYTNICKSPVYYKEIFKNSNFIFQSKALINIIQNSIRVSHNILKNKRVNFYTIDKIHRKLGLTMSHYNMTIDILLNSLEECFGPDMWDRLLRESWLKVLNITVENIKYIHKTIYYNTFVNNIFLTLYNKSSSSSSSSSNTKHHNSLITISPDDRNI